MLTIGRKLMYGKVLILVLIAVIVCVSIISINSLSKTANLMQVEYEEVNSTHELQISLQQALICINGNQGLGNNSEKEEFEKALFFTKEKLAECKKIITNNHNKKHLINFENDIMLIESLARRVFIPDTMIGKTFTGVTKEEIKSISNLAIEEVSQISIESEREMDKYIQDNQFANKRGKHTVIFIALLAVGLLLIGSFFLLRTILNPVNQLIKVTKTISSGNFPISTPPHTQDEMGKLIQSFNSMVSVLNQTMISRNYFETILNRMNDSLVMTDAKAKIKVVNQATSDLLGYSKTELIGLPFSVLLGEKESDKVNETIQELVTKKNLHNIYNTYYSKNGSKIPVLFSASLIQEKDGRLTGMIFIANIPTKEIIIEENPVSEEQENQVEIHAGNTVDEIPLTKREKEVMKLIAEEHNNRDIAVKLFISIRTVETHRKNIMRKLHTNSVIALVKYAELNKII